MVPIEPRFCSPPGRSRWFPTVSYRFRWFPLVSPQPDNRVPDLQKTPKKRDSILSQFWTRFWSNFGPKNVSETALGRLRTRAQHGKPKTAKFDHPLNVFCCFLRAQSDPKRLQNHPRTVQKPIRKRDPKNYAKTSQMAPKIVPKCTQKTTKWTRDGQSGPQYDPHGANMTQNAENDQTRL